MGLTRVARQVEDGGLRPRMTAHRPGALGKRPGSRDSQRDGAKAADLACREPTDAWLRTFAR